MRVIAGLARGRKLTAPKGLDTRPTPDRVKEALFSITQFRLPDARVLDLFSGSGQLGIEALSRGASLAVFVDASPEAEAAAVRNLRAAGLAGRGRVIRADALRFLDLDGEIFSLAFLDPPYRSGLLNRVLPLLPAHMTGDGVIFCESASDEALPESTGRFRKAGEYRYGGTKLTAYRSGTGGGG